MVRVDVVGFEVCARGYGPGGWAVLLKMGERERAVGGGEISTTEPRLSLVALSMGVGELNRMLLAAIDVGRDVPDCEVHLHSRSSHVVDAAARGWIDGWRRRGWTTRDGRPVANRAVWAGLLEGLEPHRAAWHLLAEDDPALAVLAPLAESGRREAVRSQPE